MPLRARVEAAAAVAALLLCGAFLTSFVVGLGDGAPAPVVDAPATPTLIAPERVAGRVEVLNASGRTGLARTATERLRSGGFDVVYFGNAPGSAADTSRVLDRTGHTAVARAAARRLGIGIVRTERDPSLFVDATIVLGSDWHASADSSLAPPRDGWRARIRRWLR